MKAISKLVLVAVSAVFLAGCGGGGGNYEWKQAMEASLTPLQRAAKEGNLAEVKGLIENGANLNSGKPKSAHSFYVFPEYTPLGWAAVYGHEQIAALLIENGADVNARNESLGSTALHTAAGAGQEEIVVLLIENGADVNIKTWTRTAHGYKPQRKFASATPSQWAKESGHENIVSILASAEQIRQRFVERQRIAKEQRQREIEAVIASGNVNERLSDTNTVLHLAAKDNDVALIQQLVAAGADVNLVNKRADTPLHLAARAESQEAVKALLQAGADPGQINIKGETAMAIAIESGDEDVVGEFVLANVDVSTLAGLSADKAQRDEAKRRAKEAEREAAIAKKEAEEARRKAESAAQWATFGKVVQQGVSTYAELKQSQAAIETARALKRTADADARQAAVAEQQQKIKEQEEKRLSQQAAASQATVLQQQTEARQAAIAEAQRKRKAEEEERQAAIALGNPDNCVSLIKYARKPHPNSKRLHKVDRVFRNSCSEPIDIRWAEWISSEGCKVSPHILTAAPGGTVESYPFAVKSDDYISIDYCAVWADPILNRLAGVIRDCSAKLCDGAMGPIHGLE